MVDVNALREQMVSLVNETMSSPEMTRYLGTRLTVPRARLLAEQTSLFVKNRRDCWAYVLASTPHLEVKKLISEHEHEELVHDPRCGSDHYTLWLRQGQAVGLNVAEMTRARPLPSSRTAFYAWIHMAKDRPWLEAFATCVAVEKMNDNRVIEGGGHSLRMGRRWIADLGLRWEDLASSNIHRAADEEHADLVWPVFERYVVDSATRERVLCAAGEALEIYRTHFNGVAEACERLP